MCLDYARGDPLKFNAKIRQKGQRHLFSQFVLLFVRYMNETATLEI